MFPWAVQGQRKTVIVPVGCPGTEKGTVIVAVTRGISRERKRHNSCRKKLWLWPLPVCCPRPERQKKKTGGNVCCGNPLDIQSQRKLQRLFTD